jgi:DNA-binding transcriptional MerR regulator
MLYRSETMAEQSHLRIGELSRRTGISPELLRAWERRYDLLHPTRSPGGLRLYSLDDLERVRLMSRHIADGLAAREAAELASRAILGGTSAATGDPPAVTFDVQRARTELARAVEAFDEPAAQAIIDGLFSAATIDAVLAEVVVPFLRDVGDRWQRGDLSVAHEHFASNVLRGRLLGLGRGWGAGSGRRALLACPAGERHDLGLVCFGLALRAAHAPRLDPDRSRLGCGEDDSDQACPLGPRRELRRGRPQPRLRPDAARVQDGLRERPLAAGPLLDDHEDARRPLGHHRPGEPVPPGDAPLLMR